MIITSPFYTYSVTSAASLFLYLMRLGFFFPQKHMSHTLTVVSVICKVSRTNVQTEGGLFGKIQAVFKGLYLLTGQTSVFPLSSVYLIIRSVVLELVWLGFFF